MPLLDVRLFACSGVRHGQRGRVLAAIGRAGLQFMLIIWLQGIWLPLHGYSYESTPLWSGIHPLPMTVGFLLAGPVAGSLADRRGARPFTVAALAPMMATFVGRCFRWTSTTGCSRRWCS